MNQGRRGSHPRVSQVGIQTVTEHVPEPIAGPEATLTDLSLLTAHDLDTIQALEIRVGGVQVGRLQGTCPSDQWGTGGSDQGTDARARQDFTVGIHQRIGE